MFGIDDKLCKTVLKPLQSLRHECGIFNDVHLNQMNLFLPFLIEYKFPVDRI